MDEHLTSPKALQEIMARHGLTPNHALGQNFLIDRNILDAIVHAADVSESDCVLEVGPGLGTLTRELLQRAGRVIAVEKDAGFHAILSERWKEEPTFTLMLGDALALDHAALSYTCLVSNLPYSVGTRVVVDSATQEHPPERMVMLVQKEVAERFAAKPFTHEIGPVTIWLQQLYSVEIVKIVKRTCFWPRPDVTSAVVRLQRHGGYPLTLPQRRCLQDITRLAFQQRRKQMATLFKGAPAPYAASPETMKERLAAIHASPTARAEELSVAQWCELATHTENKAPKKFD